MSDIRDPFPTKDSIEEDLESIAQKIPALPTDFSELRRLLALLPSPDPSETPNMASGDPLAGSIGAAIASQSSAMLIGLPPAMLPGTSISTGLGATGQVYGDSSDGTVTISADTDLARDMFYRDLTINTTKRLNTKGFRIFIAGTLTNNGYISNNGANGGLSTGGSPAGATSGTLGYGSAGGGSYSAGIAADRSYGGSGGAGGGTGYAGGTASPPAASDGTIREWQAAVRGRLAGNNTAMGGGGGGSGQESGGVAGGGGCGGHVVCIVARLIVNTSGIIEANGGIGYNGSGAYGSGGGGGGGLVIICSGGPVAGTLRALGGAGGTGGAGSGVSGGNGTVTGMTL